MRLARSNQKLIQRCRTQIYDCTIWWFTIDQRKMPIHTSFCKLFIIRWISWGSHQIGRWDSHDSVGPTLLSPTNKKCVEETALLTSKKKICSRILVGTKGSSIWYIPLDWDLSMWTAPYAGKMLHPMCHQLHIEKTLKKYKYETFPNAFIEIK